jgi:hypothetical protein
VSLKLSRFATLSFFFGAIGAKKKYSVKKRSRFATYTFSFDTIGAKEKVFGQNHSRLGHCRTQYSLIFPIYRTASSPTGRAVL